MFSNSSFALIGVVHLPPLPGAPFNNLPFDDIVARAILDANALVEAGFDGLIVENFGDFPFLPNRVEPHTVAMMAVLTDHIARSLPAAVRQRVRIGVNVLRNDARAAVAVSSAAGADFVRVNVHVGTMATDQGILDGRAWETLRYRRQIGAAVQVLADVFVKHAVPVGPVDLGEVARDTFERGGADALVVSGSGTGVAPSVEDLVTVRRAVPSAPLVLGSGLDVRNLEQFVPLCDGAIVGTSIKRDGRVSNPVDPTRAQALVERRDQLLRRAGETSGPPRASAVARHLASRGGDSHGNA